MPEPLKLDPVLLNTEIVLNRTERKWPGWWNNFAENLPYVRAGHDISQIPKTPNWPAIVVGAGPSCTLKAIKLIASHPGKLIVIASDRMLKTLLQLSHAPDFVATVDGDPSVADFYNGFPADKPYRTKVVLNAVTTHPNTLAAARAHFFTQIYWFVSFFDDPEMPRCPTCQRVSSTAAFHYMSGNKTILQALGNVGASCWHLAYYLSCNPILMIGMDYSYQPGTEIEKTHYYDAYLKIAAKEHLFGMYAENAPVTPTSPNPYFNPPQADIEDHVRKCLKCRQRVRDTYQTKTNPDFKQDYMIDTMWEVYRGLFLPFVQKAKSKTVNCSGGALHGPGITGMELETALEKYCK